MDAANNEANLNQKILRTIEITALDIINPVTGTTIKFARAAVNDKLWKYVRIKGKVPSWAAKVIEININREFTHLYLIFSPNIFSLKYG